ncbi:MAG: NUDIX domain-containing protein [Chlamydiia bacterium]|nr:NUDIX domain-containing protein [Chlamydiia bacterium]
MSLRQEESYGAVPIRETENGKEVLVVKHKKGHWGFPKGRKEQGEKTLETVERELKEETGLDVVDFLSLRPYAENYEFKEGDDLVNKYVWYYPCKVEGEIKLDQPDEVIEAKWVPLKDAPAYLTFIQGKMVALDTIRDYS